MFNGFEAYKIWCAAKAHYLSDYDILKYNWKFKVGEDTFRLHRDRFLFERLAKEYQDEGTFKQAVGFYLYCNPKSRAKGLIRLNKEVEDALLRFSDLYGVFEREQKTLNTLPISYIFSVLAPESICIYWDYNGKDFSEFIKYKQMRKLNLLPKYNAFVAYDKTRIAAIVKKHLPSEDK